MSRAEAVHRYAVSDLQAVLRGFEQRELDKHNGTRDGLVDAPKHAMIDIGQLQGNLKHLDLGHAGRGEQIDGFRGQFVGPCDALHLPGKQRAYGSAGLGVRVDFGLGHGPGHSGLGRPGEQCACRNGWQSAWRRGYQTSSLKR